MGSTFILITWLCAAQGCLMHYATVASCDVERPVNSICVEARNR